ncbi:sigma-54 interaction domain-containing protein [Occallatibacter riparius]|uniref:Sigma-54 dependent transcriptional regulator n=1 Tax=Occallatibacter riparius TaxID=1002689 RepID=A0A9J7BQ52_9BACT|nr:sigma-54 dependent transcriptional regulator [Occallatibacter riparius]UWZ83070.1 sigma-54 dependent transcriptional regulator [Occallatibacter riparius]
MQLLLASATGKEFQFFLGQDEEEIRELLEDRPCDVVILDMNSHQDGVQDRIECGKRLMAEGITLVILADDSMRATASDLVRQGAYGYLRRPPSIRELRVMLRRAYESSLIKQTPDETEPAVAAADSEDAMVGSSDSMRQVHHLVGCVANIDASVLIVGESGTGKELVARAIHNRGSRARKPFVAVSCGAIPETLIEAELFGHEKGAFTGTVGAREGFFEQAGDGTLFLDEIGELSPYTQVKLLRVLQQREFSRLGSNKLIPLRARLVFATHRDLSRLVAEGKFRQDLYYRINVMKIETPSLDEHSEDIPQIAMHFLHRYSQRFGKHVAGIDSGAMAVLQNYNWPGNVRELENVIQQAVIMADSRQIRTDQLPAHLREEASSMMSDDSLPSGSFERQLRDYKIRLAENAIRENNGNKTMAARSLSISRAYLHRLIRSNEPEAAFLAPEALEAMSASRYN